LTEAPDPGDAVAVYVHWPYCARICPYCDFNVVRDRGRHEEQARLVDAMIADLETQAGYLGPRRLASVFFGGGTPSLMPAAAVARIIDAIRIVLPATGSIEITLEANPTDAEAGHFESLRQAGVNRLSLGVQALDDADLRFLGRNHGAEEARRAIATAGRLFERLSIDMIYALPGQSLDRWRQALEQAVDLGFEHISPYQLTLEPGTAMGRALARGTLIPPDEDLAADLYETTQTVLTQAGFEAYEVSNHARTVEARSAHNLHIWRGGDYLGIGPGAHGRLTWGRRRSATVAHRGISAYIDGVARNQPWADHEVLTDRAADEERVLLGLRTVEGVPREVLDRLGLAAGQGPLPSLIEDGWLAASGRSVVATAKGRPVLDAVLKSLLT